MVASVFKTMRASMADSRRARPAAAATVEPVATAGLRRRCSATSSKVRGHRPIQAHADRDDGRNEYDTGIERGDPVPFPEWAGIRPLPGVDMH